MNNDKIRFWKNLSILIAGYVITQQVFLQLLIQVYGEKWHRGPSGLFFVFLSVALVHPFLYIWMRYLEKKPYLSLFGDLSHLKQHFDKASLFAGVVFLIGELLVLIAFWNTMDLKLVFNASIWLFWLIPLTIVIILQVSAEEMFFRGLLQTRLMDLYKSLPLALILPALVWGAIHYSNFSVGYQKFTLVITMSIYGLIFAHWRYRSGSLLGPFFVHLINNLFVTFIYAANIKSAQTQIWRSSIEEFTPVMQCFYIIFPALVALAIYVLLKPYALGRRQQV